MKIKLRQDKILVQPTQDTASTFSMETKKYDRKAIGIIKAVPEDSEEAIGSKVIYDDSHSIDFTIEGISYTIVSKEDIVAIIEEDK
jgi:co-chaperonin GroES (HSP10)